MVQTRFVVTGTKEVNKELLRKDKQALDVLRSTLNKVGVFLMEEIKASIRGERAEPRSVLTGRFHDSVMTKQVGRGVGVEQRVMTDVPYAEVLEWGNSKRMPRRHFTNSLARNKKQISDELDRAISKVAK